MHIDDPSQNALNRKIEQLEMNLATLNKTYLEQIRKLKEVLRQKTVKQTVLKTQVQELKNDCSSYSEEIKGMLAMKISRLKSVKSLPDNFETTLSMSFKKNKIEENQMKLNANGLKNLQTKNIRMNSPRQGLLNIQFACQNMEQKLKNSRNNMIKNHKKANNSPKFVQLIKQNISEEKSNSYSYSYDFKYNTNSGALKLKKYEQKSRGSEKKPNPEDNRVKNNPLQ